LWPETRVVDLSFRGGGGGGGGDEGQGDGSSLYNTREQYGSDGEEDAPADGGAGGSLLGPEYRRSLTCPNPEETNSAVEVTFQVCLDRERERALLSLFAHLVKDKCFDQLRTKEQLG
ncbi:unnamed protein product, partial [Hapterophycus canaliculatus]